MISQGDTFWAVDPNENYNYHLLVLISDPAKNPDKVVMVTFTTWEKYKDDTCLLEPGDHPFIKHTTSVKYDGLNEILSVEKIENLLSRGKLERKDPLSEQVLEKILRGACETKFIPNGHWLILNEQGLVD